ncbi:MAG: class I SAM-dependent methyltransferase [Patescibacteria group bacterium]
MRGKAVADVGAGSRMFGAHVLREGLTDRMYSIEPDVAGAFPEEQEQLARTLSPDLKEKLDAMTFEAGRQALPLQDASVDLLLNHGAMPGSERLEHQDFEEIRKEISDALDEVVRVLTPGGEARLFPLVRGRKEPNDEIEQKLEELKRQDIKVTIEEAARWMNPNGIEMMCDRIILWKPEKTR